MNKKYVPVLRWKQGEQFAINNLDDSTKKLLMPLIEIPPIEFDYNANKEKKTIDDHLQKNIKTINKSFSSTPFFFDVEQVKDKILSNGKYPLENFLIDSSKLNLNAIPVIYINSDLNIVNIIKNSYDSKLISELCIRIEKSQFPKINNFLNSITSLTNIPQNKIHLIFDVKYIDDSNKSNIYHSLFIAVNNLVNPSTWASISIISSSFPNNLPQSTDSTFTIQRNEFKLWSKLTDSINNNCQIQYGDYCILNPEYIQMNPKLINPALKLIYTIKDNFLVYKGKSFRDYGSLQMQSKCADLITKSCYSGSNFSYGDLYINNTATGNGKINPKTKAVTFGNPATWVAVGTSHHIKFTISNLSNISYF